MMNDEFWNNAFNVLCIILPSIITGICTFFITKYGYHKNIPLDKMEISYNRVYYPICKLIKDEKDIAQVVEKCEFYLKKYHKYVDRSTRIAFNYLRDTYNLQQKYSKKAYEKFKNNIFKMDVNLRRKLGYLEPNFLYLYAYAPSFEKRIFRILVEYLLIYMLAIVIYFFHEIKDNSWFLVIFIIFLVITLIEFVILLTQFIIRVGKKLVEKFHSNDYTGTL